RTLHVILFFFCFLLRGCWPLPPCSLLLISTSMMLLVLYRFQYLPESGVLCILLCQIAVENISCFSEILCDLAPVSHGGNACHRVKITDLGGIIAHDNDIPSAGIPGEHRTSLADIVKHVIERASDEIQCLLSAVLRQQFFHR